MSSDTPIFIEALRAYKQADADGVWVNVPRQAVDETLVYLTDLERINAELVAALELCYGHCALYHPEVERNNVGEAVRAALQRAKQV